MTLTFNRDKIKRSLKTATTQSPLEKKVKKRIGLALLSIATFMVATNSASALTSWEYDGWTSGSGYGTATKVDDNITNLKGNDTATGGMFVGPFSKASTAKLTDEGGITEEVYVMVDPNQMSQGELFEISLALRNGANEYVSEAVVMTQKNGDSVNLSTGWATNFTASISRKGVYTYQWHMFIDNGKTYVNFTLLQGNNEIATTGDIDFDTIVTPDTKNPIADQTDVSVKYLWFCNVQVANGVDVYTELPTVTLTFVDPTGEEEDLVLDVYQYMSFTEEEVNNLVNEVSEAAKTENYSFDGFYADESFTTEYDLTQPFERDTKVYLKVTKLAEESTETTTTNTSNVLPPKTSDINLIATIGMIVLSVCGVVFVLNKRFARSH